MVTEKETWPEFLQRLDALKYRVRRPGQKTIRGCELFLVDLSDWRLRFSDRTPLIWVGAELAATLPADTLVESLRDVAREQGWRHRDCLVVLNAEAAELKAQTAGQSFPSLIVVDAGDQGHIFAASSFTSALQDLIFAQIPITSLAPYDITVPAEGSSFFGRAREIDRILKRPATNFAVLGVRRIGKTSLLKEVRRRLLEQGEDARRVVWLDCSTLHGPEDYVQEIVRQLRPNELRRLQDPGKFPLFFSDFLRRMAQMYDGRITVFLDEADQLFRWARDDQRFPKSFLAGTTAPSPSNVLSGDGTDVQRVVRDTINAGHCRYIMAAFQGLMAELYDSRSPLFLAFEPVQVGALDAGETADLVLRPLRSLRVRFEREAETVARIYNETRGHPQLVQYYCLELITALARQGSRVITPASLTEIYTSEGFRALILNPFRDNTAPRDKMLIYALLTYYPESKESFTLDEMYGALQRKEFPLTSDRIDQACERLVLAGVLTREGAHFQFAHPVFSRLMRANYNLDHLLAMTRKEAFA